MSENYIEKISKMSFEEALKELESIVIKLETGNESLENAVSNYEYGNALKKHCQVLLNEAKLKIEKVNKSENGEITLSEIEIE